MYARHVTKMASLLECRVCRLQNWKLWRAKSQTSGQIYCIVLTRETHYSSKVDGVRLPYALALEMDGMIERYERYFQVAESVSPLSCSRHGGTLDVLQTEL